MIVGHAAVFNVVDGPAWFRERIAPGAFADSIGGDVRALFNHDTNLVLGRTSAGTLSLREDDTGLYMEIQPPDTSYARDLMESIRRGDISQASFSFEVEQAASEVVDGEDVRTLRKVRLYDVGPVTFPWYEATDVSARKAEWENKQARDTQSRTRLNLCRRRLELLEHT